MAGTKRGATHLIGPVRWRRRRQRLLAGTVLLGVGLVWGAAALAGPSDSEWSAEAIVGSGTRELSTVSGEQLIVWASPDAPQGLPTCQASDMVFDQSLRLSPAGRVERRVVDGESWRAAAVLTAGSDQVRISCRGEWQGAAAIGPASAPQPRVAEAVATLRTPGVRVGSALVLVVAGVGLLAGSSRVQRKSISNMSVSVPSEVKKSLS